MLVSELSAVYMKLHGIAELDKDLPLLVVLLPGYSYRISLYLPCVIFTTIIIEHMTPTNRSLVLLISFYSGDEGVSACK